MIPSNYLILVKEQVVRAVLTLFFILSIIKGEDFINKEDYAKLLYSNPRGIGCDKCHGIDAKGSSIAIYKQKGVTKALIAPPINNLSKNRFFAALNNSKSVMPKYSLTLEEIESLYYYVGSKN